MSQKKRYEEEETEYILKQLDDRMLPFADYSLQRQEDGEHFAPVLGRGGFAEVRSAEKRKKKGGGGFRNAEEKRKNSCALKVIGFGKHGTMPPEEFFENAQTQMIMYYSQKNIVDIYELAEVHLWLDEDLKITATKVFRNFDEIRENKSAENESPNYIDDRNRIFLALQFVAMEQLIPIVIPGERGEPVFNAVPLAGDDENEFLRVAYDIGLALRYMYKEIGMLHRDIKPQNIFYDPKRKMYKLGDFGIAKITEDGLTGNADAYTRGYAAPEVLDSHAQKYDNTADIYSLGMTIYLLLNDLKFPDPPDVMYQEDYVLPLPEHTIWPLMEIVRKMCRHNPEERYQNAEEALNDIENLATTSGLGYKRKHVTGELVLGLMLLLGGTVLLEFAFYPALEIEMNLPAYLFAVLAIFMGIKEYTDDSWIFGFSTFAALVLGIYLLISTGFTVWKLAILVDVVLSPGILSLAFGGILITADLAGRGIHALWQSEIALPEMVSDYRAAAMWMVTFGAILLWEASLLMRRNREDSWRPFYYGIIWVGALAFYLDAILLSGESPITIYLMSLFLGNEKIDALLSLPLRQLGIAGIALSVFWIVRERVMRTVEENRR